MSNIVTIKDVAQFSSHMQALTQSTCQGAFTYELQTKICENMRERERDRGMEYILQLHLCNSLGSNQWQDPYDHQTF